MKTRTEGKIYNILEIHKTCIWYKDFQFTDCKHQIVGDFTRLLEDCIKETKKQFEKKHSNVGGWICSKCGSSWAIWVAGCKKCNSLPSYEIGDDPNPYTTTC
jgi:hypothetical protein